ncbi:accessory gland protein Acp29AB [Drosophila eugracilis]|uniref:accessory gland protein Acp29AB n=1 Tax=Drosophila eugracilis TaxID=29029 RepID=UPI001BDA4133|nr:accessory gland protein Acp29AB [Drosophila eugracilis]
MSGLAAVLLHLLIVSTWQGSLSRPNEDCDRYCFSTMRTVMDHVVANNEEKSTCKSANDSLALQEAISSVKASLESKDVKLDRLQSQLIATQESIQKLIPQGLQEKLSRTESQLNDLENKLQSMQSQMDSHLTAIKATLSKLEVKSIPQGFERIGQRYFYIQENKKENWVDAQDTCRRMGGHLASIQNKEEFDAIVDRIDRDGAYFLGINDRAQKDRFLSRASGTTASFLKWRVGEPSHSNDQERCVTVASGDMYVGNCSYEKRFICQSDDNI